MTADSWHAPGFPRPVRLPALKCIDSVETTLTPQLSRKNDDISSLAAVLEPQQSCARDSFLEYEAQEHDFEFYFHLLDNLLMELSPSKPLEFRSDSVIWCTSDLHGE